MIRFCFLVLALAFTTGTVHAGEDVQLLDARGKTLGPSQIDRVSIRKSCGGCHDVDERAKSLHYNRSNPTADAEAGDCLSCHLEGAAFNADGTIKKVPAAVTDESCANCHSDVAEGIAKGVHGRRDKRPGDHPNCTTCHGADPHKITPVSKMTRRDKAALCSSCHTDSARMERYKVSTEAVSSYEASFHGKYVLRFGNGKAATCTDCHEHHRVLASVNCEAPTNRSGITKTCSKCHSGAKRSFCMSGANHLWLKMDEHPLLRLEHLFLRVLTYGVLALLLGLIALDLRRKAFCPGCRPRAGRLAAWMVATSLSALTAGIVMAVVGAQGAEWAWTVAIGTMALAYIVYFIRRRGPKPDPSEKTYMRFSAAQRAQHIALAASFTVLVLTGMPIRFAEVGWSHYLHLLFGGIEGARIAHRVAAFVMTGTWIWHCFHLIYLWRKAGFSLRSWTMVPTRKDFADFVDTVKYGLGLRDQPPQYDRFQFREKFDYFAVYWGMPIMVLSGLVLWFPVYFGNTLSQFAFAVAYIAHSDEALLALLAILVWHLYNTHFDPEHFPMSKVWYSGALTDSEMQREHPVEKARIDKAED